MHHSADRVFFQKQWLDLSQVCENVRTSPSDRFIVLHKTHTSRNTPSYKDHARRYVQSMFAFRFGRNSFIRCYMKQMYPDTSVFVLFGIRVSVQTAATTQLVTSKHEQTRLRRQWPIWKPSIGSWLNASSAKRNWRTNNWNTQGSLWFMMASLSPP